MGGDGEGRVELKGDDEEEEEEVRQVLLFIIRV